MLYGLIGEKLRHSFSKIIHEKIAPYTYSLLPLENEKLDGFMREKAFDGINVTIPYKERVIPYLDYIDREAEAVGAVNTVVKRDGKLYGYNTDIYGINALIRHIGISLSAKKVAILGSGGTAKTARAVAMMNGASEILIVSRTAREGVVTYEELYENHKDVEILINTTPVGMYPNPDATPLDISKFDSLIGVIDTIYNPLRTNLILDAQERGIPAEGGLYMLVAQAVKAIEIFLSCELEGGIIDKIYHEMMRESESIVLIGMPSSGKSTVGKVISERLGRELIDTDQLIVEEAKISIPEIFRGEGEVGFRDRETAATLWAANSTKRVIATGGGAILRRENVRALRRSGRLYFIDRPVTMLIPTEDRPLSQNESQIKERYNERYPIYTSVADVIVDGSMTVSEVASSIIEEFCK